MNDILPTPINEARIKKILAITMILFCILPTVLNIVCLTPIYFSLENNTVYKGSAITLTLKYISDLFDIISFGSVYAMIIFSLVLLSGKVSASLSLIYVALLLLKIPARLLMNIPLYGTIGTTEEIIADLISLVFYFLIEIIQFFAVLAFASVVSKSYLRSVSFLNKKSNQNSRIEHILPIKKFVNWYNPLLRAAIYSSITVIVFKVLARLVTDIDAGAPSSFGEVMIIAVNYLTDAIYGLVAYVIAIFIFNWLFEKLTNTSNSTAKNKNKADDESSSALFDY